MLISCLLVCLNVSCEGNTNVCYYGRCIGKQYFSVSFCSDFGKSYINRINIMRLLFFFFVKVLVSSWFHNFKFYLTKTVNIQNTQNSANYWSVRVSLVDIFCGYKHFFLLAQYWCCLFIVKFQVDWIFSPF